MGSSAEFREKAADFARKAALAEQPQERETLLRLQQSYASLASNEEWLDENRQASDKPDVRKR
jgi:hypothetical protein